jgi:hypothetical protein
VDAAGQLPMDLQDIRHLAVLPVGGLRPDVLQRPGCADLVVLAEEAPAQSVPDEVPRLRVQADVAGTSLWEVADLVSD